MKFHNNPYLFYCQNIKTPNHWQGPTTHTLTTALNYVTCRNYHNSITQNIHTIGEEDYPWEMIPVSSLPQMDLTHFSSDWFRALEASYCTQYAFTSQSKNACIPDFTVHQIFNPEIKNYLHNLYPNLAARVIRLGLRSKHNFISLVNFSRHIKQLEFPVLRIWNIGSGVDPQLDSPAFFRLCKTLNIPVEVHEFEPNQYLKTSMAEFRSKREPDAIPKNLQCKVMVNGDAFSMDCDTINKKSASQISPVFVILKGVLSYHSDDKVKKLFEQLDKLPPHSQIWLNCYDEEFSQLTYDMERRISGTDKNIKRTTSRNLKNLHTLIGENWKVVQTVNALNAALNDAQVKVSCLKIPKRDQYYHFVLLQKI